MKKSKEMRTKALAVGMTATMAAGMLPVTAFAATGDQVAADGTYTSDPVHVTDTEGDEWNEYDVTVSVTVADGKIADIAVNPSGAYDAGESSTYFGWAVDTNTKKRKGIRPVLIGQAATADTVNSWDTVSGATRTSEAVKAAALQALAKAPERQAAIDTTALENAIAAAEAYTDGTGYTEESWTAMQNALAAAKAVLEAKDSQETADQAAANLNSAVAGLQEVQKEEAQYVLMNIPYDVFYRAELGEGVTVDGVSSATKNKTRTPNLSGGSYHVNADGTDITGVIYPVKVGEGVDLSQYTQVTDKSSVTISVTNRGQSSTNTYTGKDALYESASYSYYVLQDAPAYYKEMNADGTFSEVKGEKTQVSGVSGVLNTKTQYGDYQLNLNGINFETDNLSGVILETTDGSKYGLRHLENIWLGTQLAWSTGFTTTTHGCQLSWDQYVSTMGKTIDKVTYLTQNGIYEMDIDDVYLPGKFAGSAKAADAAVQEGAVSVTLENVPADFDPEFSVKDLTTEAVKNADGTWTLKFQDGKPAAYTLTVKDKSGKYADLTGAFTLSTADMPAAYESKEKKLAKAEGFSEDDFAGYLKNIASVNVDGTDYAASGRGSTPIIDKKTGAVDLSAKPFAAGGEQFAVKVTSTGYPDLEFTVSMKEEKTEEYQYVYAGLSWAEFWAAEGVQAAGDGSGSGEADKKGELDKGAFDTVTRATTNHGLHRGSFQSMATIHADNGQSYQVSHWSADGKTLYLTDGSSVGYSRGTMTLADGSTTKLVSYEVTGMKYVPVKVKTEDYEAFKAAYPVVEKDGTVQGGFSENKLSAYSKTAEVTEETNGLKEAVKNENGSFSFGTRKAGSASGLKGEGQKQASGIDVTVKPANGSYGEFLRVDLNGDYGDLASNMYAVRWTYYGNDSSYTTPQASYGTKFAADNWMHKAMGIQLGLTESQRCQLPAGTDGTGYWTLTVYAMGYADYTVQFEAAADNIVTPEPEETVDTSRLEALVKQAEALKASDYTEATWNSMQTELEEAKEIIGKKDATQAMVDEAEQHLDSAIKALKKAEEPKVEKNTWKKENGKWYYYDANGKKAIGWVKVKNTWYYMDNAGVMQTGWVKVKNTWYYMNGDGAMQTGWVKVKNTWYYMNGDGAMQTGWVKVKNTWYYMNGDGAMQTGWVKVKNTWYYMNGSGAMATGWVKVKNTWYYMNGSGAMATGWVKWKGSWYYMDASGAMATGWRQVKGSWYYMYSNGKMAAKTRIGKYYVDASGKWIKGR